MKACDLMVPERVVRRLIEHADRTADGHLISRYSKVRGGYAQVGWQENGERVVVQAHVVAWVAAHGPVPQGMTVDHRCFTPSCVEITHLRLLTLEHNSGRRDGQDWPLGWACKRNHDARERFRNSSGAMECRACRRITFNEWQRARRAADRQRLIDAGEYRKPGRPRKAA